MRNEVRSALMGMRANLQARKANAYNEDSDVQPRGDTSPNPSDSDNGSNNESGDDEVDSDVDEELERQKIEFFAKKRKPKGVHETIMNGQGAPQAPAAPAKGKGKR